MRRRLSRCCAVEPADDGDEGGDDGDDNGVDDLLVVVVVVVVPVAVAGPSAVSDVAMGRATICALCMALVSNRMKPPEKAADEIGVAVKNMPAGSFGASVGRAGQTTVVGVAVAGLGAIAAFGLLWLRAAAVTAVVGKCAVVAVLLTAVVVKSAAADGTATSIASSLLAVTWLLYLRPILNFMLRSKFSVGSASTASVFTTTEPTSRAC